MTSYVDMSLDDIIQKKKKDKPRNPKNKIMQLPMKNSPAIKKLHIQDARNKIISKKRSQISDARDILVDLAKQKDARLKLEKLRLERKARTLGQGRPMLPYRGKFVRTILNKEIVFGDPSRQVAYQSLTRNPVRQPLHTKKFLESHTKKFLESRSIGIKNKYDAPGRMPRPKPIIRTVQNDLQIIDDPMEEDYIEPQRSLQNRTACLQLKIVAQNNEARGKNRPTSVTVHRPSLAERDLSPPRPPSILKKRPMAALRSDQITQNSEKPAMEYRIIVSNLRSTVTAGDIEELFGDVGGMLESRLVRPGTAEVIYKTQDDAQKAVELYHNRQLDGQPMNCLLVTPRTPSTSQRNSSKPALYSTNSNVEPDITTFHKVLFSNL